MSMSKKPRILLRVVKGALVPADELASNQLRARGYHLGDEVHAQLTKPRNPLFHRLAHAFGRLVAENIDDFAGMDPHQCLKRLQWESNAGCDVMGARVPGVGFVEIRIPQSLSFSAMDESTFKQTMQIMARHVAELYWQKQVDADQVLGMAEDLARESA